MGVSFSILLTLKFEMNKLMYWLRRAPKLHKHILEKHPTTLLIYVGYSESKYRLRISLAHPRDRHFAHVQ